ncbi:hypothetical protein ASD64_14175 [Mesorhizobium sp. Root157]|uniref:hypothetical protein n=1 Tax=Mesorhizobium sp. Root157 TaxID=1736477 RepID=UPI0006F92B55|nr:hypothetical protein [Mesorhizobium sp. Root157]KQZ99490.1 hypothetical protein ASD64_14175 [Mesorhizobium sp. Root157]
MMNIVVALVLAWVSGGLFFIRSATTAAPNSNSDAFLSGLRRAEPAAVVALVFFMAVWPAVWIGAHVRKLVG